MKRFIFHAIPSLHLLFFSCSILTEERLERLTQGILLNLESPEDCWRTERLEENVGTDSDGVSLNHRDEENMMDRMPEISKLSIGECKREEVTANGSHEEHQMLNGDFCLSKKGINDNVFNSLDPDSETVTAKRESSDTNCEDCDMNANDCLGNKKVVERCPPNAVLPLLPYCQCESSESSSRYISYSLHYVRGTIACSGNMFSFLRLVDRKYKN